MTDETDPQYGLDAEADAEIEALKDAIDIIAEAYIDTDLERREGFLEAMMKLVRSRARSIVQQDIEEAEERYRQVGTLREILDGLPDPDASGEAGPSVRLQ